MLGFYGYVANASPFFHVCLCSRWNRHYLKARSLSCKGDWVGESSCGRQNFFWILQMAEWHLQKGFPTPLLVPACWGEHRVYLTLFLHCPSEFWEGFSTGTSLGNCTIPAPWCYPKKKKCRSWPGYCTNKNWWEPHVPFKSLKYETIKIHLLKVLSRLCKVQECKSESCARVFLSSSRRALWQQTFRAVSMWVLDDRKAWLDKMKTALSSAGVCSYPISGAIPCIPTHRWRLYAWRSPQ